MAEYDTYAEKILIATDGSETSMRAANMAVSIGKASGASLTAVYVLDVHRLAQLPAMRNARHQGQSDGTDVKGRRRGVGGLGIWPVMQRGL